MSTVSFAYAPLRASIGINGADPTSGRRLGNSDDVRRTARRYILTQDSVDFGFHDGRASDGQHTQLLRELRPSVGSHPRPVPRLSATGGPVASRSLSDTQAHLCYGHSPCQCGGGRRRSALTSDRLHGPLYQASEEVSRALSGTGAATHRLVSHCEQGRCVA